MKEIKRDIYLQKLIDKKENEMIKVITGIRRCGKSTILEMYIKYLKEQGIKDEQIIKINLENQTLLCSLDYDLFNFPTRYSYTLCIRRIEQNHIHTTLM